jgi:hypothetical protein
MNPFNLKPLSAELDGLKSTKLSVRKDDISHIRLVYETQSGDLFSLLDLYFIVNKTSFTPNLRFIVQDVIDHIIDKFRLLQARNIIWRQINIRVTDNGLNLKDSIKVMVPSLYSLAESTCYDSTTSIRFCTVYTDRSQPGKVTLKGVSDQFKGGRNITSQDMYLKKFKVLFACSLKR